VETDKNNHAHTEQQSAKKIQELEEFLKAFRVANHNGGENATIMHRTVSKIKMRAESMNLQDDKFMSLIDAVLDDLRKLFVITPEDIDPDKIPKMPLPETNIVKVDESIDYYNGVFHTNGIAFGVRLNGNIREMIDGVVSADVLRTMIARHLKNALIAIRHGGSEYPRVYMVLGMVGDCFELTVLDTGSPFQINILEVLGLEFVTTHSDEGGSGIGLFSTWQEIRKCKASLIICEKPPGGENFSKSVTIRFDKKDKYIIQTFRPDEFPKSSRYVVLPLP